MSELVAGELGEADRDALHAVVRACDAEQRMPPGRAARDRTAFARDLREFPHGVRRRFWRADLDGPAGFGTLTLRVADPREAHRAKLELCVAADRRRRGIGTALLEAMLKAAAAEGRSTSYAWAACSSAGEGFLAARLQRRTGAELWCALDLRRASPAATPVDGLELLAWAGPCSADRLDTFADLHRDADVALRDSHAAGAGATGPLLGELEAAAAARGDVWRTVAAREPATGVLVGFSQLRFDSLEPELAAQEYTAVRPAWRRRGIAGWLKAAMLADVRAHHPRVHYIATANAADNAGILAVNRALGFEVYLRLARFESTAG